MFNSGAKQAYIESNILVNGTSLKAVNEFVCVSGVGCQDMALSILKYF